MFDEVQAGFLAGDEYERAAVERRADEDAGGPGVPPEPRDGDSGGAGDSGPVGALR